MLFFYWKSRIVAKVIECSEAEKCRVGRVEILRAVFPVVIMKLREECTT